MRWLRVIVPLETDTTLAAGAVEGLLHGANRRAEMPPITAAKQRREESWPARSGLHIGNFAAELAGQSRLVRDSLAAIAVARLVYGVTVAVSIAGGV